MILRKAFSYLGYSLFGSVVGLMTLIYMTRVLDPEEMGIIGLFMTVTFFLIPMIGFKSESLVPINRTILREIEYLKFRNSYISFSIFLFVWAYIISIVFFLIYEITYVLFVFLIFPISFLKYVSQLHSSELIQEGKSSLFGKLQISTSIGVFILTVVFISFIELSWDGRLIAILLVEAVFVVYRVKFQSDIWCKYKLTYDREEIAKVIRYGAPLFLALAISWVIFESDKVIVLKYFSIADLGLYTVAFSIGVFFNKINASVAQAVLPRIYEDLKNNRGRDFLEKYSLYYGFFILCFATLTSIIFYNFSGFILGENYDDSKTITCIVLFAYALFGISRTSGIVLNFYKLNVLKTKLLFFSAVANLIFSLSMISVLGLEAPAYGTLLSFLIMAGLFYVYSRKELDMRGVNS